MLVPISTNPQCHHVTDGQRGPSPTALASVGLGGSMGLWRGHVRKCRWTRKRRFYKSRYTSEATAAMGGTNTKAGTPLRDHSCGEPRQAGNEWGGRSRGQEKKARKQEQKQETIMHQPNFSHHLALLKRLAGTESNVWQKQGTR